VTKIKEERIISIKITKDNIPYRKDKIAIKNTELKMKPNRTGEVRESKMKSRELLRRMHTGT
jgi:hypothetical protein